MKINKFTSRISGLSLIFTFLFIFVFLVQDVLASAIGQRTIISLYEIESLILFVIVFIVSIRKNGLISETTFFLMSFWLFILNYPTRHLLNGFDIFTAKIISYSFVLSNATYIICLKNIYVALLVAFFCIMNISFSKENTITYTEHGNKFSTFLYYALFLCAVPYQMLMAQTLSSSGYGAMFNGFSVSGILHLSSVAYEFLFPALIGVILIGDSKAGIRNKIFAYAISCLLSIAAGRRATVLIGLLLCAILYNQCVRKIKIRPIYIALAFVSFILISSIMLRIRGNEGAKFSDNGSSIYVMALSIDNYDDLNSDECNESGLPYSFGIITKDFVAIYYKIIGKESPFSGGQSINSLRNSNYLGWELTYLLSPNSFLTGYGVGSCYMAESYMSYKIGGVVFFTLIMFYIVSFAKGSKEVWAVALYFAMLESFIRAPRGCFYGFLIIWIKILIIYWSYKIVESMIHKQKKSFSKIVG